MHHYQGACFASFPSKKDLTRRADFGSCFSTSGVISSDVALTAVFPPSADSSSTFELLASACTARSASPMLWSRFKPTAKDEPSDDPGCSLASVAAISVSSWADLASCMSAARWMSEHKAFSSSATSSNDLDAATPACRQQLDL